MAYGAYQIAQPTISLQDQLIRGRGQQDVGAEVATKKRSLRDDLLERMRKRQKSAEKRAGSFLGVEGLGTGVTTALDFAAGFVDPATAAIMGAVSGGLSGFNQMRSADKLEGATQGFEQYGFLSPQVQDIKSQIKGQQKNFGDVLMSAGTQALQNFTMGKAGEAMSGVKAKPLSGSTVKPLDTSQLDTATKVIDPNAAAKAAKDPILQTGKGVDPSNIKSIEPMKIKPGAIEKTTTSLEKMPTAVEKMAKAKPMGYQGAEKAKWLEGGFDFADMSPEDIMSTLSQMGAQYAPILQGLTEQGEQYPQIDYSGLY